MVSGAFRPFSSGSSNKAAPPPIWPETVALMTGGIDDIHGRIPNNWTHQYGSEQHEWQTISNAGATAGYSSSITTHPLESAEYAVEIETSCSSYFCED